MNPARLLIPALAATLTACATVAPTIPGETKRTEALRQYGTPIMKPVGRSEFTVRVDVQEREFVDDVCKSVFAATAAIPDAVTQPAAPGKQANGCSVWHRDERRLDMYVVEPQYLEDLQGFATIGHELWHGVRGRFHP